MQILLDDKDFQKDLLKLRTYAIENVIDISDGDLTNVKIAGDDENHVIRHHFGIRLVYSIENQPSGMYHHLSVSYEDKDLPSPAIVDYLIKRLGISTGLNNTVKVWQEEKSINILAPVL